MFGKIALTVIVLWALAFVVIYYYYMYALFNAIFGTALPIVIAIIAATCIIAMIYRYLENRRM